MPRRKPVSSKQRKAELQIKRAIKRGDLPAPDPLPKPSRGRRFRHGVRGGIPQPKSAASSSRRLQSAFLKVEPEFLERSKAVAGREPLPRPFALKTAVLDECETGLLVGDATRLTCPKRPKWRFDMEKKEVEQNEEGMYQKWMQETDEYIEAWRANDPQVLLPPNTIPPKHRNVETVTPDALNTDKIPRSLPWYERNLEVWRQFWRVSEISQILLLLLDSRCPTLHFPHSLHMYLTSLRPPRPLILVLTKSDLVPVSYTAAWTAWFRDRYPSVRIVQVESYREQDVHEERKGQGQRRKYFPEMKLNDLRELVGALKDAHTELVTPPEKIRSNEEKVNKWKPSVRRTVDWDILLSGQVSHVDPQINESQEFITVGLIGQPNVGKSSLLNAIFGTHKVKASRTPGKTKHFQTLFWTPEVRLVDCPGLVIPNFVRMELQVLCGILPISNIPSIPACIYYALCLIPLERILQLAHPSHKAEAPQDKRTWREDRTVSRPAPPGVGVTWTAMDVLTAYANLKGWVTAKAGRPDTNRAGNALLRALAEGKIRWAFWPPGMPLPEDHSPENIGIWLGDAMEEDTEEEYGDVESSESGVWEEDSESTGSISGGEEELELINVGSSGRFGALVLDEDADSWET